MNEVQTPLQTQSNTTIGFNNAASFELGQRVAKMLSTSTLVPAAYHAMRKVKGKDNIEKWEPNPNAVSDCMIALNMAHRMGADPLMVLQNLIIVNGRPTWSSQFLIATFNSCGRYSSIKFVFFGEKGKDHYGCRAVATELATGERLEGPDVTIELAKAEGWYNRNGSKWKTIPDLMLRYRAAAWFVRTVAPELSMGLHTQEEIYDSMGEEINPLPTTRKPTRTVDSLIDEPAPYDAAPVVDTATGEIIEPPAQAEPAEPEPELDQYTDLRLAISECQTTADHARLLNEMKPQAKRDLHQELQDQQAEINALKQGG